MHVIDIFISHPNDVCNPFLCLDCILIFLRRYSIRVNTWLKIWSNWTTSKTHSFSLEPSNSPCFIIWVGSTWSALLLPSRRLWWLEAPRINNFSLCHLDDPAKRFWLHVPRTVRQSSSPCAFVSSLPSWHVSDVIQASFLIVFPIWPSARRYYVVPVNFISLLWWEFCTEMCVSCPYPLGSCSQG